MTVKSTSTSSVAVTPRVSPPPKPIVKPPPPPVRSDEFKARQRAPVSLQGNAGEEKANALRGQLEAKLKALPSNDGTRMLKQALQTDDLTQPNRAALWQTIATKLFVDTAAPQPSTQLQAKGDWSQTSKREVQDLQSSVAVAMLVGGVSAGEGAALLEESLKAAQSIGTSQSIDERHDMLWGGGPGGIAQERDPGNFDGLRGLAKSFSQSLDPSAPNPWAGGLQAEMLTSRDSESSGVPIGSPAQLAPGKLTKDSQGDSRLDLGKGFNGEAVVGLLSGGVISYYDKGSTIEIPADALPPSFKNAFTRALGSLADGAVTPSEGRAMLGPVGEEGEETQTLSDGSTFRVNVGQRAVLLGASPNDPTQNIIGVYTPGEDPRYVARTDASMRFVGEWGKGFMCKVNPATLPEEMKASGQAVANGLANAVPGLEDAAQLNEELLNSYAAPQEPIKLRPGVDPARQFSNLAVATGEEAAADPDVDLSAVTQGQLQTALETFHSLEVDPNRSVKFLGPTADGLYLGLVDGKREAYELKDGTFIQRTGLAPGETPKIGAPRGVSTSGALPPDIGEGAVKSGTGTHVLGPSKRQQNAVEVMAADKTKKTVDVKAIAPQQATVPGHATTWDGKSYDQYYSDLKKLDIPKPPDPAYTPEQHAKYKEMFSYGQANADSMHLDDWTDFWRNQGGAGFHPTDEECFKEMQPTVRHPEIDRRKPLNEQIEQWKTAYPEEYQFAQLGARARTDFKAKSVAVTLKSGAVEIKKDGMDYKRVAASGSAKLSLLKDKGVNVVADQIASRSRSCEPGNGESGAIQSSQLRIGNDVVEFAKTPLELYGNARFDINGPDSNNLEKYGQDVIMRNTENYTEEQKQAQLKGNSLPYRSAQTHEPVFKVNGQEVRLLAPNNSLTLADGSTVVRHGASMDEYYKNPIPENKPYYEVITAKYKMTVNFYEAAMDAPDMRDTDDYGVANVTRDRYMVQEYKIENIAPPDAGGTLPTGLMGDILSTQNYYSLADVQGKEPGVYGRFARSDLTRYTEKSPTLASTGSQVWPG